MATRRKPQAEFDRVPPYDEDAERAVLGSMLLNPDMVGTAIEILRGQPSEIFYFPAHQYIYEAVLSLYRKAKPIDAMLLKEQLLADGHLDDVGGIAYIADLSSVVPTSANMEHYARIVSEKSILRRLITSCTHIVGEAYDSHDDVQGLLDRAEGDLFRIADQRQTNPVVPISELVDESVARFEKEIFSDSPITGLATGFDDLDKLTHGFQPSDMIVLAARPSVGKTALALNISLNAAVKHGKKVVIFSLEMSKAQLMHRLICMQGKINLKRLQEGYLAKDEFPKVQKAADALLGVPIFIDDSPNISIIDIRAKARRQVTKYGCDLIVIDYLQLMSGAVRAENRQVEIAEISRSIKGLARELKVPVLALSQLSREAERDESGRPKLSHLRESGAIEQDADVVLMLYRPPAHESENAPDQIYLDLSKQRNGPTGRIELVFEKHIQRFRNAASGHVSQGSSHSYRDEEAVVPDMADEDDTPF